MTEPAQAPAEEIPADALLVAVGGAEASSAATDVQDDANVSEVKADGELSSKEELKSADEVAEAVGDEEGESDPVIEVKPITIRLPTPTYSQTIPKQPTSPPSGSSKSTPKKETSIPSTLIIHPQSFESIQDVRASISDWLGGYWLGPYSLRIPGSSVPDGFSYVPPAEDAESGAKPSPTPSPSTSEEAGSETRGQLLTKGKEGVEVRVEEKLPDWLEIGEVFGWVVDDKVEDGEDKEGKETERVLVVQREPYSETEARQAILRLREYTMQSSDSTLPFQPLGVNGGASVFEGIRDGSLTEVDLGRKVARGDSNGVAEGKESHVNGHGNGKNAHGKKGVTGKVTKGGKPPVIVESSTEDPSEDSTFTDWKGWTRTEWSSVPTSMPATTNPACYKSLVFSPFNPPPAYLRQRGHLLYATVTTLENETLMLVCTTKGWHVARTTSPNSTFDPAPRIAPKDVAAHSLMDVMHGISPLFTSTLRSLQSPASASSSREPITTVPIPQYPPAYPWLADTPTLRSHAPDLMRTQLAYGYTGATSVDALEGARDWNEELQNAREMPRGSTQERVLRERVLQKTHAEFTAACIKGTMAIGRGDLPPINPHEASKAHMWLANNIFFTKGVNSVDAYNHLGGDEAAHVSHAKDALGVTLLNKLDIDNVYLLGHTVVDWQGERWICQSVLPGIFSRRRDDQETEETKEAEGPAIDGEAAKGHAAKSLEDWVKVEGGEPAKSTENGEADAASPKAASDDSENYLIIYGADSESGIGKLHWDAGMHKIMQQVASSQHSALHKIKDAQGKEYDFWTSADVKGLRGSDGRRYLLDLPRLSPVDIEWLEKDYNGELLPNKEKAAGDVAQAGPSYPHRVTLLRTELVDAFWEHELKSWARKVHAQDEKKKKPEEKPEGEAGAAAADDAATVEPIPERFELTFNADAFVEQAAPASSGSIEPLPSQHLDESDPAVKSVRDASVYLRTIAIPAVVIDFIAANTFGILDGASLSKHLHSRGINIRYLGYLLAVLEKFLQGSEGQGVGQLYAIMAIVQQEMVFRASKHILRRLLHGLTADNALNATAHFLNCLLGTARNPEPLADYAPNDFGPSASPAYAALTPTTLREQITAQIAQRYRWRLDESYLESGLKKPQLLREFALRFAFQLVKRDYDFEGTSPTGDREDTASGTASDDEKLTNGHAKGKKGKRSQKVEVVTSHSTFEPADIIAMLPVVKSAAPSATVSEEIFEMGRNTISRGNMAAGLELMLEGINIYEQIHQVVHPEVAMAYNQYAVAMHQLVRMRMQQIQAEAKEGEEEPPLGLDIGTAVKLQKQAIMAAERTIGLDNAETIGYYYNLAMLENLQGEHTAALRYFKHVLAQWDVAYGRNHPELPSTLMHIAMILQTKGKHTACITLLNDVHRITVELYGKTHILAGSAMNQLTQAHFLNGDIQKALESATQASEIFNARLGAEDAQSIEAAKNVELLSGALEHNARVAAAGQQQIEAMARIQEQKRAALLAVNQRRRQALSSVLGPSTIASSSKTALEPRPSTNAPTDVSPSAADREKLIQSQEDVDELVKYIQGGGTLPPVALNKTRGKHALRGKRRTGAKR